MQPVMPDVRLSHGVSHVSPMLLCSVCCAAVENKLFGQRSSQLMFDLFFGRSPGTQGRSLINPLSLPSNVRIF